MNSTVSAMRKLDEEVDFVGNLNGRLEAISSSISDILDRIRGVAPEDAGSAGGTSPVGSIYQLSDRIGTGHSIASVIEDQIAELERFI
jgi:hypothetical protein